MNLSFLWKIRAILVVCGFLALGVCYEFMLVEPNQLLVKRKTVQGNMNSSEKVSHAVAGNQVPQSRLTRPDLSKITPPLIYLTYGNMDPEINHKKIKTRLGHRCTTTIDHKQMNHSDALLIDYNSAFRSNPFTEPIGRKPDQMYVYFSREPPWFYQEKNFSLVDKDFFNWTMTYRRDSDIYFPYPTMDIEDKLSVLLKTSTFYGDDVVNSKLSKKSKENLVLVAISHCDGADGPIHRLKYVEALEKAGLRMKKIGKCFDNYVTMKWNSGDFRRYTASFKFVLAFENGYHCRDYITEKTWNNALRSGAVPVIWGASKPDVEAVLPSGSYMHVDDFDSPKQLAEHLMYLDSNETAYAKYFDWRRKPPKKYFWQQDIGFEMLCNKLWEKKLYNNVSKVYHSFKDWYIGQDNPECFKITNGNWI
uniref:Fucosyltransferase n=1 Tax=Phallusia mammillata TaxID=59560 RepID=A0A6F9DDR2_9ASCI|nr:alpha3-fucosyltransferase [Phallusia mammillata]